MFYEYARVSSSTQVLAGQMEQLTAAGAVKVFQEKVSGAAQKRPALARAIKQLEPEPGDVLTVTHRDRLARSTRDLLNVLDAIKEQGAGFKLLADDWANTTTPHRKLILTMLGRAGRVRAHANQRAHQ